MTRLLKSTLIRYLLLLAISVSMTACQDKPREEVSRHTQEEDNRRAQPEGSAEKTDDRTGMMGDDGMMGRDGMGGMMHDMPEWMMSGDMHMDRSMMRDMHVIHGLLMNHEEIRREVEDIPGGVRAVTTSSDPEVAGMIRTHVYQMKDRIEEGRVIRHMDPLFREIFKHHEKIEFDVEEITGGVRITETSRDPEVASLIRQHARRAVSEFVEEGMRRAMQPTALPEGYQAE